MWPHDLKLQRARKHFDELEGEVGRWVEVDGYSTTVEPHPEPPNYIVKAHILRPVEEDPFSLLLGDFVQNARAALDHLAFALGDAGAGGVMPEEVAVETMFPIIGDVDRDGFSGRGPDLFAEAAKKRLRTVSEDARAVIERMQPYYEGGEAWMMESLWIIHELARYDRHRFVHLAAMYSGQLRTDPAKLRNVRIESMEIDRGKFLIDPEEDGTEVARFTAHPADTRQEMQMHFKDALFLGLDNDTLPPTLRYIDDSPIDLTLFGMYHAVDSAIRGLREFLPANPPL